MTKLHRRLRCTASSARALGALALGHGELLEVGADLRLALAAQQASGDVLECGQPMVNSVSRTIARLPWATRAAQVIDYMATHS